MPETTTPNLELDTLYGTSSIEAGAVKLSVRKVLTRGNMRALTQLRRRISALQTEMAEIRKKVEDDGKPDADGAASPVLNADALTELINRTEEIDDEIAPLHWEAIQLLCIDPPAALAESSSDVLSSILVGALLSQMKAARTIIKEDNPDHPLSESSAS